MRTKVFWSAATLSVILLGVVSIRTVDAAGATVEEQLIKMENDWADSYVKRDPSFVQKITTDDFMFVGPDGSVLNKGVFVKIICADHPFTGCKITSLKVRVFGDSGVVIGIA